jgi:putative ABC transport system permease protein
VNFNKLTSKNIFYHIRFYKLIAIATLITVTVIVGSLAIGESVRSTLVKRVGERLGDTKTIIFSRNSFLENSIISKPLFGGKARGILMSNGFISDAGRLIPVMVWGVDDKGIAAGEARINRALHSELSSEKGDLVLRLPATGLVPSGSLFVTDNYTTSARLSRSGIIEAEDGGNLHLKNEQIIPCNVFVNRTELASILQVENKINLILYNQIASGDDLSEIWNPALSGVHINEQATFTEITSDRVFLQEAFVRTLYQKRPDANRLFSYMVNSLEVNTNTIPYSFVTASDQYEGKTLQDNEVILSDYSAKRLHANVNDSISLTYFVSENLKTLTTDTFHGRVAQIVPLSKLTEDKTLSANFPGLSDVEKCTDWDSDLPINMDLITKEDENYWELYKTAPKAIIPYTAISKKWGNVYGNATAIRIPDFANRDMSGLNPAMFGIQIIHPQEEALAAARNGVDFSSLFLSLGFFIILSAILLMLVPLSEMIALRRNEIRLYRALGFPEKRIIRLLWNESAPVVFAASILGVAVGILYTTLMLSLLGNVWKGATHTSGFNVTLDVVPILTGMLIGCGLALGLLRIFIARSLKISVQSQKPGKNHLRRKFVLAVISTVITLSLIFPAVFSAMAFFALIGLFLIVTSVLWVDYAVTYYGSAKSGQFNLRRLIWANLYAAKKRTLLSFFALTAGVYVVFSVGLNRQGFGDDSQIESGTGGFSLWCESSVPVYHNMNTKQGREKLALTGLPEDTRIMQILRYDANDASCLNLNKVSSPTVLGIDMDTLKTTGFKITRSIYPNESSVFDALQTANDSVYPALIDETVLMWSLMKNLGDTIVYESENGRKIYLQLAGTLSNSIFQGNILIDKNLFSGIWNEITGSEIALFKLKKTDEEATKKYVLQALNEYGVRVTTTADRLEEFGSVTNAYLNIFLTLGGLGFLLGLMTFVIVVRKNCLSGKEQAAVYRALGFPRERIIAIFVSENRMIPLFAIAIGIAGSLVGNGTNLGNIGSGTWILSLLLTLLFVSSVIYMIKIVFNRNL